MSAQESTIPVPAVLHSVMARLGKLADCLPISAGNTPTAEQASRMKMLAMRSPETSGAPPAQRSSAASAATSPAPVVAFACCRSRAADAARAIA